MVEDNTAAAAHPYTHAGGGAAQSAAQSAWWVIIWPHPLDLSIRNSPALTLLFFFSSFQAHHDAPGH